MKRERVDPSDFNEGGTYDGVTLLELSKLTRLGVAQARPFQEDGELAVLAHELGESS